MLALRLDHIGFLTDSLQRSAAAWRRLGFSVTSPRPLWQAEGPQPAARSLGQTSAHVMFSSTYLEITALEGADPQHHLAPWRGAVEAPVILALSAADPVAVFEPLHTVGHAVSSPSVALRRIEYGAQRGEARFEWFMWQHRESPEWLVCVMRHLTPELVFQRAVQEHANGAVELTGVYQAVGGTPSAGLRFAAAARGVNLLGDGEFDALLELDQGTAAAGRVALRVTVRDLAAARACLHAAGVACLQTTQGLRVAPADAGGAWLLMSAA
ncbi:MAG: VOC family protein [Sinobacteraceae bacterium]|nr:VOC family protein [Nevskiaceae bacterium]